MIKEDPRRNRPCPNLIISCERFRKEIVERKGKFTGFLARHMKECEACKDFIDDLRSKWLII